MEVTLDPTALPTTIGPDPLLKLLRPPVILIALEPPEAEKTLPEEVVLSKIRVPVPVTAPVSFS